MMSAICICRSRTRVERDAFDRLGQGEDLVVVLGGQEALGDALEHQHRGGQHDRGEQQRELAPAEDATQRPVVEAPSTSSKPRSVTRVEAPAIDSRSPARKKRALNIGVSVSETKPETRMATGDGDGELAEQPPKIPPMNRNGRNTATSESVMDTIVKPISRAPSSAAWNGGLPLFHVAHDVLEHHDGVVHDEADAQRQRHQRQVVEAVAEQVHHREGAEDRTAAWPGSG